MTRLMKKIKRRSMLKGLSLQARLPFLICALLLCVILVFSTMAYLEVRNSARKVAQIRLNSRIVQLATTFSQSTQGLLSANARIASNPDIISYLESGASFEKEAELLSYLASTRTDSSHIAVQVFDTNHKLKLSSKFSYIRDFDFPDTLLASLDSSNAGRLVSINDSVFYPLFSPVKDGKNNIIGYVVKWRLFKTTREALRQYTMLLGPEPQIFVGNKNASLWTDLITPIKGPEKIDTTKTNVVEFRPDGYDVYATVKDVPGTPWLIMLGVPRSFVLQSVGTFLNWLFLAGGILLVVGFGAAWFLSRSITQPITKLTAATSAITSGGSAPPIDIDRTDEIGKLARAFNAMIIRVSNARNDLEKKVYEAETMNDELRSLSARLQHIREQERIHIAREMHDELGQMLTGFKMDVSWLHRRIADSTEEGVNERLESLKKLVDEAVHFVRRLAAELRPSVLDDLGLVAALEWHSLEFQKRFNINVSFKADQENLQVPSEVGIGLFRMYQESLTNVARHASAQNVTATLESAPGQVCLSIMDDGKGFDMNSTGNRKTLGLLGMRERAHMIGGQLDIISSPGKGTAVIITVPLKQDETGNSTQNETGKSVQNEPRAKNQNNSEPGK